jgi:NAD(P)-dependent dehydrogenase (short-subunit alcohol dehydrogenase family)
MAGQVVLITGAAGGLGSSLARAVSSLGAELVLLDKHERGLNQLHDEIADNTGVQPGLYPLDLAGANADDYDTLAKTVADTFGKLHGVVHCAANVGQITPAQQIDIKHWVNTFNVNVHGPMMLTQSLLPLLGQTRNASITFTIDDKRSAYWGAYAASKAAIETWMLSLADELDGMRDDNGQLAIRCNAINPGPMRTTLRRAVFPGESPEEVPLPNTKVNPYLYLLSQSCTSNREVFTLDPAT